MEELPRETQKAVRDELRKAVEPVKDDAQKDLLGYLNEHKHGKRITQKTKFGVTVRRTGVVSVEQRVRSKGGPKRPKFSGLQLDEALIPAANRNEHNINQAMTDVLERLQRKWVTG